MEITHDKILGSLFGVAMGDAMGKDPEFMHLKEIHKFYGKSGVMDLPYPALFTDDTQMTIAVGDALVDARNMSQRELVRTLTNAFVHWRHTAPSRAPVRRSAAEPEIRPAGLDDLANENIQTRRRAGSAPPLRAQSRRSR